MTFPADILSRISSVDPSNPRLIWYGPDAERIELSGRVLDNWVAKSANFLVDYCDIECGDSLTLDLPMHWRSMVLCLAGWSVGAEVRLGVTAAQSGDAQPDGAIVSVDPDQFAGRADGPIAAIALAGLAMRFDGDLASDVIDYNAEARACGDVFIDWGEPDAGATAVDDGAEGATYADLTGVGGSPARRILPADKLTVSGVTSVLGTIAAGGCMTLVARTRAVEIPQIARAEGIPELS